ncbi:hypothetical protein LTR70_003661 [Exophiala xenobiotica]|uniref:Enoyl reductase (ER) domain-containing protein n=1 Tax=Lithohypha guttulata TaxID=1690604 RepID=A0ABR0KFJ8_9EURO|nr:hypothetical protein LTR24_003148 [Lithohypha guttulata]KAK5322874.1 hypothetical protein LTR70_003661 [Exophiala xenobiotica]
MRAVKLTHYVKGPQELQATTEPTPQPSPNQYLIRIRAAGTNFFDLLQIQGKYQHQPPLPHYTGAEFAGIVLATPTQSGGTGSKVVSSNDGTINAQTSHQFKVGDRVFGQGMGAYATHILAPESNLFPIPEGWSFEDAAGLYVTMPTAYGGLIVRGQLQSNEWCLIHAGAGGVGLSAVMVAKAVGATVIATAGTERKRQTCLDYGADYVIDYGQKNWPQQVIEICAKNRTGNGKAGVDVVYDPVGMIDPSIKCITWNGRLVVIGFAGGNIEKLALNRVLLKNISVTGLHWGRYAVMENETLHSTWKGIFEMINKGQIRGITYTDKKYVGLDSLPAALTALGGRDTWGKVAITIPDDEEDRASKSKL